VPITLTVSQGHALDSPADLARGLLKEIRSTAATKGVKVSEEEWKPWGERGLGGVRVAARVSGPEGSSFYTAFLVHTDRLYLLAMMSPTKDAPEPLQAVRRSFRLLSPRPAASWGKPFPCFSTLLLIVVLLACSAINRMSARTNLNGGRIAAILIVILLVLRVTFLPPGSATGVNVGEMSGEAIIAWLIATVIGARFRRRNHAQAAA
jgi:hypothetical protein